MVGNILAFLLGGIVVFPTVWLLLSKRNNSLAQKVISAEDKCKFAEEKLLERNKSIAELEAKKEELNNELMRINNKVSVLEYELNNKDDFLASKEELYKEFSKEFEIISNKILEGGKKNLVSTNKEEIDKIVSPLQKKISEFEHQIKESYDKELRDKVSLKTEIVKLLELNNKLSKDAENLTNALKGDQKSQGNWGEVILENILERSGLKKGVEYELQEVTENNQGDKIQPDLVVYLPEDKHIIIDSKVSLLSYEQYVNSDTEQQRMNAIKDHVKSLRSHIDILSKKSYQSSKKHNSLDFVLMFVPIEPSYFLALQSDNNIFWEAWEKKILIVSPATLHSTLKIIVALWKQEKQNKNVKEIARLSGALYDKFVGFLDDMQKIGRSIDQADQTYNNAMQKLSFGKGNIMNRFEVIKDLGAKTSKSLPQDKIES